MDVVAVTVRVASSRLPRKCLLPIGSDGGNPISIIEHIVRRLKKENFRVVVCTSSESSDNELVSIAKQLEVEVYRGSMNNKICRWYSFLRDFNLRFAHFLDCDDPFFSIEEVNQSISQTKNSGISTLPSLKSETGNASVGGTLTINLLTKLMAKAGYKENFEMVFPYAQKHYPKLVSVLQSGDPIPAHTRLTIDYFEDYLMSCLLWIKCEQNFSRENIHKVLQANTYISELNKSFNSLWKHRQEKIVELEELNE